MAKQKQGPDFLVIGAAKAGTTWLWQMLGRHPQCRFQPVKEVDYFSHASGFRPHPVYAVKKPIGYRIVSKQKEYRRLLSALYRGDSQRLQWCLNYAMRYWSFRCYQALFCSDPSFVSGDFSPRYQLLESTVVQKVRSSCPNVKVIFIIRNQVDRTLSHINMGVAKGWLPSAKVDESLKAFLGHPELQRRNDYLWTIRNWEKYFGVNFKVFIYERLMLDPQGYLDEVCDFLGIDRYVWQQEELFKRYNSFPSATGDEVRAFLKDHYAAKIAETMEHIEGARKYWGAFDF